MSRKPWPATSPSVTKYNGQLGKLDCRACGRRNCTVLHDFSLLKHGHDYSQSNDPPGCAGPPEGVFEELLHAVGGCAGTWRCRFPEAP